MSDEVGEIPLYEQVGYDYKQAIRDLLKKLTYEELALRIGYSSTGSVTAVLKGRTPSHTHGEALWALYLEVYGKKPPLNVRINARPEGVAPV